MRTTLFTPICAILPGAVPLSAQQTTDKYVINGKEIQEVFDGSQLEGLKVESYKIETSTEGGTTVRTHVITTSEVDPSAKEYNDPQKKEIRYLQASERNCLQRVRNAQGGGRQREEDVINYLFSLTIHSRKKGSSIS